MEKYLGGMHYPAERQKLVDNAQKRDAPSDVMDLLNKLPKKTYNSPIDITKEIGKIEWDCKLILIFECSEGSVSEQYYSDKGYNYFIVFCY